MFRTSNPMMAPKVWSASLSDEKTEPMSVQGTVNRTLVLLALAFLSAAWVWSKFAAGDVAAVSTWIMAGAIGGLVLCLVTVFKLTWAAYTAPLYALCEGLLLGGLSAFFEVQFPGIVIQSVALTFGTLLCMLALYSMRIVRATEKFKMGVFAATGAIAVFYLVTMVLGFFGVHLRFFEGAGMLGIGISVFVVIVAALNLVLDFDIIEQGVARRAPKYMEWYGAFALLVTLVWLYMEILRLLSKLRSRD